MTMFKKLSFLKKKTILAIPIALISLEIFAGVIIGYLAGKFFSGKRSGEPGLIKSIKLTIGGYKLHLHHWVACTGALAVVLVYHFPPVFPQFSYGLLGGLIFQGIFSYSDWYKIIIKNK